MRDPSDRPRDTDAEPRDPLADAERRQAVDDYDSQVRGEGARTQVHLGGAPPGEGGADERESRPDAAPPTSGSSSG